MRKNRNIGIDLLRIISMLLVVILHVIGNGKILDNCKIFTMNYNIVWFLEILAYCSVNCYALISGYVGIDSKFKYSNILNLWLKVVFYTVIISIIFFILVPETITINNIISAIFPVLFNQYWYFTSYFCMFFFIPFFNKLLEKLSKQEAKKLVLIIIIFFTAFAMISPVDIFSLSAGYSVLWLSSLYLIGGYIKKYNILKNWTIKKLLVSFLCCTIFIWTSKIFTEAITIKIFGEIKGNLFLIRYNSIFTLLQSVFLLLIFSRLNIKRNNKFIQYLSTSSFSVYLIHTHPLVWQYIIRGRFKYFSDFSNLKLVISIIFVSICIYAICSGIDFIRYKIFEMLKVEKFSKFIISKLNIKETKLKKT